MVQRFPRVLVLLRVFAKKTDAADRRRVIELAVALARSASLPIAPLDTLEAVAGVEASATASLTKARLCSPPPMSAAPREEKVARHLGTKGASLGRRSLTN